MAPRAGTLTLVLLLSACGHDSPSGPTSPTTTVRPAAQCRRYATALTSESRTFVGGKTYQSEDSGACTFDSTSAVLRCTFTDSSASCPSTWTTSTVYASLADFVEEATAVGRFRYQRWHTVLSGCGSRSSTESITYDGMKRPLTSQFESQGMKSSSTFAAWDALGRPTQQVSDSLSCAHSRYVLTYDDTARSRTSRITEAGTGPGCTSDYSYTVAYDPDGNVAREVTARHGATTWSRTSTITSTGSVCF